jgi:hypothetical protein
MAKIITMLEPKTGTPYKYEQRYTNAKARGVSAEVLQARIDELMAVDHWASMDDRRAAQREISVIAQHIA